MVTRTCALGTVSGCRFGQKEGVELITNAPSGCLWPLIRPRGTEAPVGCVVWTPSGPLARDGSSGGHFTGRVWSHDWPRGYFWGSGSCVWTTSLLLGLQRSSTQRGPWQRSFFPNFFQIFDLSRVPFPAPICPFGTFLIRKKFPN